MFAEWEWWFGIQHGAEPMFKGNLIMLLAYYYIRPNSVDSYLIVEVDRY